MVFSASYLCKTCDRALNKKKRVVCIEITREFSPSIRQMVHKYTAVRRKKLNALYINDIDFGNSSY